MKEINSITHFKDRSTRLLLGLGVITYRVYFAHYIKKQSAKTNEMSDVRNKISAGFVNAIIIMSYVSLVLFFAYVVVEEGHPIAIISNVFDRVWGIMLMVWGFMARNRLNKEYEISKDDGEWFHGLWAFLFSPLYFNYKINSIDEENVDLAAPADS